LPFFAAALLLAALDYSLVRPEQTENLGLGLAERVLIAARAAWFYPAKLAIPAGLTAFYPKWPLHAAQILLLVVALVLACLLLAARPRIGRGPFTVMALYGITLLPTLGLIPFSFMQHAYVADRYQYLASAAPLAAAPALVAALGARLTRHPGRAAAGFILAILPVLAALTFQRARAFADTETYFRDAITRNEDAWVAHMTLGALQGRRGDWSDAERSFRQVLRVRPSDAETRANLAVALVQLGRKDEAVAELDRALEISPSYRRALDLRIKLTAPPQGAISP
jgi:tetratricopeptide (TPR) repeat protein